MGRIRTIGPRAFRLACTFAFLAAAAPAARAGTTDLDDLAGRRLPWRAEVVHREDSFQVLDRGWLRPVLLAERGGAVLRFTARNPGIVLTRIADGQAVDLWQHNLAPEYCHRTPCASLAGLWDADGDGDEDLVLTSITADGASWLFRAVDLESGLAAASVTLPAGPDVWPDGRWDGVYAVLTTAVLPGADGPRRAYLVVSEVGHDREPRGVQAVDTVTGAVLWTHFTGAKPAGGQARGGDLDGDGAPEAVFLAGAVNNVGRDGPGGLGDDVCAVVAVDTDGSRLWTRRFPGSISGFLDVAAGAGRSTPLVVVHLSANAGGSPRLVVLDGASGEMLDAVVTDGPPRGLGTASGPDGLDIYCGLMDAGVARYRFDGRLRLLDRARSRADNYVKLVADLLPEPGPEVFTAATTGAVTVLGADLQPLGHIADRGFAAMPGGVTLWPEADGETTVMVHGNDREPGFRFRLLPNPRPIPWGALTLLPVAGGAAWYARRRRRGTSAATRRELRLQLLGRLELSGHGAIGALRSLRRLVWLLDARAQAADASPALDARLAALLGECRDHMLPDLEGTLELAALAGCDAAVTGQARAARERLARLLDDGGADPRRDELLRETAALLESAMMSLRREVEDDFRADLAAVVSRVLEAHAEAAAAAGVAVATEGLDQPLWCRGDTDELVFVVDNLVENALRAMAASPRRELVVRARRDDNLVLLQVQDTGCGIAPDDWETVLETRMSTREGGGLGLPESRRRLRKHGGSLAVTASTAGAGTTLTMSVAPARAQESV